MALKRSIRAGLSRGFILSLLIHAGLFFLASLLIVFSILPKEDKKFVPPPPVERPRMTLKKPKVKVQKKQKPPSPTRIVTKNKPAEMAQIQLPERSGFAEGLAGGISGFDLMPDLSGLSQFGNDLSVGSDLVGRYYDFNRLRSGKPYVMDPSSLAVLVNKFFTRDWSPYVFAQYYRSPQQLYTTSVAIPPLLSTEAPAAFGEPNGKGWCWLVHYEGELVHREDVTFRFWGHGDDVLAVRVNGEMKLLACFPEWVTDFQDNTSHHWQSRSADSRKYPAGNHHSVVGDWITLKAGEPQSLEILIGESHGGIFSAMLMVEVEGEDYPRNPYRNGPILPFFKTSEFSRDMQELIEYQLQPGDATCIGGPVFNDYGGERVEQEGVASVQEESERVERSPDVEALYRNWTLADGTVFEAAYKTLMGRSVIFESRRGRQQRIALDRLSLEDRGVVIDMNPPEFEINFSKRSEQRGLPEESPWLPDTRRMQISDFEFVVRLEPKKVEAFFESDLEVEYLVFAEEVEGDNYVLVDRYSHVVEAAAWREEEVVIGSGTPVEFKTLALFSNGGMRGIKYGGYLVLIRDAQGGVIQSKASHDFLIEHYENLKRVPLGKHFDRICNRVAPPRPGASDRPDWL